jgi:glycosyltransferase involved in cell wall biosynthesis
MAKPDLGIVSPLPPLPSGVADYALEQARALAGRWTVTFLVDDAQPDPTRFLPEGTRVERWSRWAARHERGTVKLLHHMGNNPQHEYVLDALESHGGIVLLHELGLHNLMAYRTLGHGDETGYERLLRAEISDLAPALSRAGALGIRSAFQYALTPLCGSVITASDGVIVHSPYAARELERRGCAKPVAIVPHFFAPRAVTNAAAAKARFGQGEDVIVFGSLGFMTDAKLTFQIIGTLGRLKQRLPPFRYLLVGEAGDAAPLRHALEAAGIADRTTVTGYVDDVNFWAHLNACDIVFSLRYPSGGETSGTLVRALGLGKAAIAFDYGPFADFPDDALVKIPLDTQDSSALAEAVLALAGDAARRAAIGRAAMADSAANRDPRTCADQISDFIMRACAASP